MAEIVPAVADIRAAGRGHHVVFHGGNEVRDADVGAGQGGDERHQRHGRRHRALARDAPRVHGDARPQP